MREKDLFEVTVDNSSGEVRGRTDHHLLLGWLKNTGIISALDVESGVEVNIKLCNGTPMLSDESKRKVSQ